MATQPTPPEEAKGWNELAAAMGKVLVETHQKMWERAQEPWRELMTRSPAGWPAEAEPVAQTVAGRLTEAQGTMERFLELSTCAWKAMAPKVESGEEWESTLRASTEALAAQLRQGPQEMASPTRDNGELWRLYLESWVKGGVDEQTLRHLLESPALGYPRELTEGVAKGFEAWLQHRRANGEYLLALGGVWTRAFEQFMRKLAALGEKGETLPNLRQWLALGFDTIDEVFAETLRSEEYIRLQAQMVNSAMEYRLQERELVEALSKTGQVPSRRDQDEAARRIYELRKEVESLRETVAHLSAPKSSSATG